MLYSSIFPMSKSLVIFYSLEGNTKFIAEQIAGKIGADLLQLHPENDIKANGFMKYVRWGRQVVMKEKPKLQPRNVDLGQYENIIFWTPVRAYTYTPALRTFFADNHLHDKKIFLFCCHEGNKGKTLENMEKSLVGNTIVDTIDFFAPLKKDKEEQIKKLDMRLEKYF